MRKRFMIDEAMAFLDDHLCSMKHADGHWECEVLLDQEELSSDESKSMDGAKDVFIRVNGDSFLDCIEKAVVLTRRLGRI